MAVNDRAAAPDAARRKGISPLLAALALLLIVLFAGLGTWQVVRLQWKLDLIARVDARLKAAPAAPPAASRWGAITSESDEYRRILLTGVYLYDLTTPVQALTEQGSGYWLMTPMCLVDGTIVLVNRGFIPAELGARTRYAPMRADADPCAHARAAGTATVSGLLRTSEHGPLMRANVPLENRWYSRDVAAIKAARHILQAAPFFVDAGARQNPPGSPDQPEGGLTVVSFHNSHLVYAITWYALALMVAGASWWIVRGRAGKGNDERYDRTED
jgi:surfeit locus 1 family protein